MSNANLQKLRDLLAADRPLDALRIAAAWPTLGVYNDAIRQGHAAARDPEFYKAIEKDPAALVAAGIAAVKALAASDKAPSTDCGQTHPTPGCHCLACRRARPKGKAISPTTRRSP